MRCKRAHRHKNRKRYIHLAQTLSLVILGTYGISQVTTPSYALLTDQEQASDQFSSAFVFPNTVSRLVNQSHDATRTVANLYQNSAELLANCQNANSTEIEKTIQQIQQNANKAKSAVDQSNQIVAQLQAYSQRAQSESDLLPTSELNIQNDDFEALQKSIDAKKQSALRVKKFIDEGYNQAQSYQADANETEDKFKDLIRTANQLLQKQKEIEEAEKKKKLEEEQQAKEKAAQLQSPTDTKKENGFGKKSSISPVDPSSNSQSKADPPSDSKNPNQDNGTDTSKDEQSVSNNKDSDSSKSDNPQIAADANNTSSDSVNQGNSNQ